MEPGSAEKLPADFSTDISIIPAIIPPMICQWNTFPYFQSVTAADSKIKNKATDYLSLHIFSYFYSLEFMPDKDTRRICRS